MITFAENVLKVLEYFSQDGRPSNGLVLPSATPSPSLDAVRLAPLFSTSDLGLRADAVFRDGTSPLILFKSSETSTNQELRWHRIAWNLGAAPLLWVTTPDYIRLYNAFQPPEEYGKSLPLLQEFPIRQSLDTVLRDVSSICGRRQVAMGAFWRSSLAKPIDRQHRVDSVLLQELNHLLRRLLKNGLPPDLAQKLIGRCIFFQYLLHRGHLPPDDVESTFGASDLHSILTDIDATYHVFEWLRDTFNGDLFPMEDENSERRLIGDTASNLKPLSDFFGYFNIENQQGRLFPFRFDAIPAELISSIYQQFVRISHGEDGQSLGVHYTPLNLVALALDPVFEGIEPDSRVLDLTCGSGVFLVESLRRLVWLTSHHEPLSRDLLLRVLLSQVRGVDISPAALAVAAFSLYLSLLELDPSPPQGISALEELRFPPLLGHVLFSTSAFDPRLDAVMFRGATDNCADVIVGNPPWTYDRSENAEDRASRDRAPLSSSLDDSLVPAPSGTGYARARGLPLPPRSRDWPFLWRCRDFSRPTTRIAIVMKATPFFSLGSTATAARALALEAFPNVALVNLSQLRTARLFQESSDETAPPGKRKTPTAGPALLFLSNGLTITDGCISVSSLPWSSTFRRTGLFELPVDQPQILPLNRLKANPRLLKAAAFGTQRDTWFLDRLSRNPRLSTFTRWCAKYSIPAGEGYQRGQTMPAGHLIGLPNARAHDASGGRLPSHLPKFRETRVHRRRDPRLFRGPLVLLPEGALTRAPIVGRYTAVFDSRNIAYNSSFLGVSFARKNPLYAKAFAGLMHSRLIAYQLAFTGGTVGVKQTKVEVNDLAHVRFPPVHEMEPDERETLAEAFDALTGEDGGSTNAAAGVIDEVVEQAARLDAHDRRLLQDADRRTRAIFFETHYARDPMEQRPDYSELSVYAKNLCETFNALASEPSDHILVPGKYFDLDDDLMIVELILTEQSEVKSPVLQRGDRHVLGALGLEEWFDTDLPYLTSGKGVRVYTGNSVYLLKPAQYRNFSAAVGQSDADRIVADLMLPDMSATESEEL